MQEIICFEDFSDIQGCGSDVEERTETVYASSGDYNM